jgi:hypothetical protein
MRDGWLAESDRLGEVAPSISEPADQINPVAVAAMAEEGIDIALRDDIKGRIEALLRSL